MLTLLGLLNSVVWILVDSCDILLIIVVWCYGLLGLFVLISFGVLHCMFFVVSCWCCLLPGISLSFVMVADLIFVFCLVRLVCLMRS